MTYLTAAVIGVLAGAHISTWGMYKDSPHEGFTWRRYSRSILLALALGLLGVPLTGMALDSWGSIVTYFGMVYLAERALNELWKGYIREEDQSKYFIPMQFSFRGRPIHDRRIRWSVAALWIVVAAASGAAVLWLQLEGPAIPPWAALVFVGSIGGWLTAFGGAWKDAPIEGFELLKFFRSPLMSLFWAALIAFFTDNYLFIALAGAGYSVATWETYKTFFFPSKPRGKFAGKPMPHTEMLRRRQYFVPLYVGIWILIVTAFILAFTEDHQGLIG